MISIRVDRLPCNLKRIVMANLLPSVWVGIPAGIIRTGDIKADAVSGFERVRNSPEVEQAAANIRIENPITNGFISMQCA